MAYRPKMPIFSFELLKPYMCEFFYNGKFAEDNLIFVTFYHDLSQNEPPQKRKNTHLKLREKIHVWKSS